MHVMHVMRGVGNERTMAREGAEDGTGEFRTCVLSVQQDGRELALGLKNNKDEPRHRIREGMG